MPISWKHLPPDKKNISLVLIVYFILFFLAFVWPTLYRYEKTACNGSRSCLVRINRITTTTEVLWGAEWILAREETQ